MPKIELTCKTPAAKSGFFLWIRCGTDNLMQAVLKTLNGTEISNYAFGTMQWGGKANDRESRAMYDACRASGNASTSLALVQDNVVVRDGQVGGV